MYTVILLYLVVHCIPLSAAITLEQVGLCPALLCHLMVVDCFFGQLGTKFFHFIARHLMRRHDGESTWSDHSQQDVLTQPRVTSVLKQHDSRDVRPWPGLKA